MKQYTDVDFFLPFQDFLLLDELEDLDSIQKIDSDQQVQIIARNITFSWKDQAFPTLSDLSMEVTSPQLVAIVGSIGSGKVGTGTVAATKKLHAGK